MDCLFQVAGKGLEPLTSGLWARRATRLLYLAISFVVHLFSDNNMAEEQGFEPWRRFHDLPVFKTGPFNHLGIPPVMNGPCRTRTYDQSVMGRQL